MRSVRCLWSVGRWLTALLATSLLITGCSITPVNQPQSNGTAVPLDGLSARRLSVTLASDTPKEVKSALAPALQNAKVSRLIPKGAELSIDSSTFKQHGANLATATATVTKGGLSAVYTAYLHADHGSWRLLATQPQSDMDPAVATYPVQQAAQAEPDNSCTTTTDFGNKTPVLLVHGWHGDPDSWKSMRTFLNSSVRDIRTLTFGYETVHDKWVSNPEIGPTLAKRILCLSNASLRGGGDGKVIVVAHSMGGLALRYAASMTIGGRKVADVLRLVITIGTPHAGSLWANVASGVIGAPCKGAVGDLAFSPALGLLIGKDLCLQGEGILGLSKWSRELSALPKIPSDVPVHAIAGRWSIPVSLFNTTAAIDTRSDGIVGTESALAEYTQTGKGDGTFTYGCTAAVLSDFPCWHGNLPDADAVQQDVKTSIQKNLSSVPPLGRSPEATDTHLPLPPHRVDTTMLPGVKIPYLDTWDGAMSEIGVVMNVVDHSSCKLDNAACPHIMFLDLNAKSNALHGNDPVGEFTKDNACSPTNSPAYQPAQLKAYLQVGGADAQYYEQQLCPPGITPVQRAYLWYVPSHHLLVVAEDTPHGTIDLAALRAVVDDIQFN